MPFGVASYDSGNDHQQLFDNTLMPVSQVIGWADPGQPTSAARWRIFKVTYDPNFPGGAYGGVLNIKFMNGSVKYDQVWDNEATATFS